MEEFIVEPEIILEDQIREHFFMMNSQRINFVKKWYYSRNIYTIKQKKFIEVVGKALKTIDYNYRISTIEPSVKEGKIYFQAGTYSEYDLSCYQWQRKAEQFAPEYGSDMATLYEAYLWYAYRVANGNWTFQYVCDDSSAQGNYRNSPSATLKCEASGARRVGGACDGVGNTYKILKHDSGFALSGGSCLNCGHKFPVADYSRCEYPRDVMKLSTAVVVLRKCEKI